MRNGGAAHQIEKAPQIIYFAALPLDTNLRAAL